MSQKQKSSSECNCLFSLNFNTVEFRWVKKKGKKFCLTRVYQISSYIFLNKRIKNLKWFKFKVFKIHANYKILQKFLMAKRYISFVILINIGDFPHILLIRSRYEKTFYIPGNRLDNSKANKIEHSLLGLQKKLNLKKSNITKNTYVGNWIFPEKENRVKYLFFPPHTKERKKEIEIRFVQFKNQGKIRINSNWDLYAVLPFKLFTSKKKYKLILAFFLYVYVFKI